MKKILLLLLCFTFLLTIVSCSENSDQYTICEENGEQCIINSFIPEPNQIKVNLYDETTLLKKDDVKFETFFTVIQNNAFKDDLMCLSIYVLKEELELIRSSLSIELIYEEPITICSCWSEVSVILISLSGEYKGFMFQYSDDDYSPSPLIAYDEATINELISFFE